LQIVYLLGHYKHITMKSNQSLIIHEMAFKGNNRI